MIVRICRGLVLTSLAILVSIMLGGRDLTAADVPSGGNQLTPVPADSGAASQPEASPFREESPAGPVVSADEGEYEEFYGLPVCSPPGRFWLRADYLMWWTNGTQLPPLVTSTTQNVTSIAYGNGTVNDGGRSGFRTTLGMWLDACHVWDLEFDYLSLGEQANGFSQYSTGTGAPGNPILTRPFFNVHTMLQDSELVAYSGIVEGTVSVDAKDYFQSAGVSLSYNLCSCNSCSAPCDPCGDPCAGACTAPLLNCCRTDLIVGYRYYNLSDSVVIHENLYMTQADPTHPDALPKSTFDIHDSFRAQNDFHGSEIGLRNQIYRGRWSLEILTKIALGNNHEVVTIAGQTVTTPNQPSSSPVDGVFAVTAPYDNKGRSLGNVGTHTRDVFTMIPQLGLELGCQVNCHWRAYVGYNVLYWGSVFRAADQIDLNLDPRNIPPAQLGGGPFPAFIGRTSSFWAQGVNVGTEFRF